MVGVIYAAELAEGRRKQLLIDAAEYRLARRARGLLPVGRRARLVAQAAMTGVTAAAAQLRQPPVRRRAAPHPVGLPARRPDRLEVQVPKEGSRKVAFHLWPSRTNRRMPRSRAVSCTTPGR